MYTVLARKWRPQSFDDTYGQDHVLTTLKNAISMDRVAHAYLFSGPRGVGKTTVTRIFAKSLNCIKGPTVTPCGICSQCQEIMQGQNFDVLEIDGASNRRIDDIREVEEHVKFTPLEGKYKIYIIDEVHMLTKEAFNALLKTLEEPPPHIKFFFATTEPDKIPDTILSRCQHFAFKRVKIPEMVANLKMILKAEKITYDAEVLFDIARAAEGSLRDAQSLLDQVISYSGKHLNKDDLQWIIGSVGFAELSTFVEHILNHNYVGCLQVIEELVQKGKDLYQFVLMLIQYLRDVLVIKVAKALSEELVSMTDNERGIAFGLAEKTTQESLLYMIQILMKVEYQVKTSSFPRLPLEISVIKMIQAGNLTSLKDLVQNIRSGNLAPSPALVTRPMSSRSTVAVSKPPSEQQIVSSGVVPTRPIPVVIGGSWEKFLCRVRAEKVVLGTALHKYSSYEMSEEQLLVVFKYEDHFFVQQLEQAKDYLQKCFKEVTGGFRKIIIRAEEKKMDPVVQEKEQKRSNKAVLDEPLVQKMIKAFDGKVTDISRS
jgi:DNA polymerase-3 subunit gamma/tau